jgi:transcriptional regulator with XRE-family HTH domain
MRSKFTDDVVTLREQQLGEVGAVLAGDSSDECAVGHGDVLRSVCPAVCELGWHVREDPIAESLGRRIAAFRAKLGLTQNELADRLAVSRTAVSHLETGMAVPGERTVVLLAGLFKIEPRELVAGTSYPMAKAERLPAVAARYTEIELLLLLLDNDLAWLERTNGAEERRVLDEWEARLRAIDGHGLDLRERESLREALAAVRARQSGST